MSELVWVRCDLFLSLSNWRDPMKAPITNDVQCARDFPSSSAPRETYCPQRARLRHWSRPRARVCEISVHWMFSIPRKTSVMVRTCVRPIDQQHTNNELYTWYAMRCDVCCVFHWKCEAIKCGRITRGALCGSIWHCSWHFGLCFYVIKRDGQTAHARVPQFILWCARPRCARVNDAIRDSARPIRMREGESIDQIAIQSVYGVNDK